MSQPIIIELPGHAQLNTIRAALAVYETGGLGNPEARQLHIHEIACGERPGMTEDISLDQAGILELIESLHEQGQNQPKEIIWRCAACKRPEEDCSADPCAAVVEDRGEADHA